MGAPKKYTARALEKQVGLYFDSISREIPATEKRDSGLRDKDGHVVWEYVPILNKLGTEVLRTEYVIPPMVGDLCDRLQIHRSTWWDYCDAAKHPEFSDTTTRAQGRLRAWREEQLVTRKNVRGIIFDLQNNYGSSDKREIELGPQAGRAITAAALPMSEREELLRELAREFGAPDPEPALAPDAGGGFAGAAGPDGDAAGEAETDD